MDIEVLDLIRQATDNTNSSSVSFRKTLLDKVRNVADAEYTAMWRVNYESNLLHLSAISPEPSCNSAAQISIDSPAGDICNSTRDFICVKNPMNDARFKGVAILREHNVKFMYVLKISENPKAIKPSFVICLFYRNELNVSETNNLVRISNMLFLPLSLSLKTFSIDLEEHLNNCIVSKDDKRSYIYKVIDILSMKFSVDSIRFYLWDDQNKKFYEYFTLNANKKIIHGDGSCYSEHALNFEKMKMGEACCEHKDECADVGGYTRIWMPLFNNHKIKRTLGFFLMCDKKNDVIPESPDFFSDEDFRILEKMSRNISIGLSNIVDKENMKKTFLEFGHEATEAIEGMEAVHERLMNPVVFGETLELSSAQEQYLEDIKGYNEILKQLYLQYADRWGQSYEIHISDEKINFLQDILVPCHRAADRVARKYSIYKKSKLSKPIHYDKNEFKRLPYLCVDPVRIKQVVSNVLTNAIKYSSESENFEVRISLKAIEKNWALVVADRGFGIESKIRNRVFEKEYRSVDARRSAVFGSGLGLFLSKVYIEKHGGRIFVVDKDEYHIYGIDEGFETVIAILIPKRLAESAPYRKQI